MRIKKKGEFNVLIFKRHLELITSARSSPLHESFYSTSSTHKHLASPSSSSKFYFKLTTVKPL